MKKEERIHHRWDCNWNKKTKDEQELLIEKHRFTAKELRDNLNKHVKVLCKIVPKLKGRELEVKEIIENFIIDVYTSSNLK